MNKDTLCDRVEAWRDNTGNMRRRRAIDIASADISRLSDVIIPDECWNPGLKETLGAQLCAIQSAIDGLKARSPYDANIFGVVLGKVRSKYSEPKDWPKDLADDHMTMMLAVLKYAIERCYSSTARESSDDEPETCYGRVAEALEQGFLYRKRGLARASQLTCGLFRAFALVYSDAVVDLYFEMKGRRIRGKK
ncbi:hypothetical protein PG994_000187 [Apiospora phragmitis]|uniref:Uncharacterized protein n=1 Tax=Apiospora phragmitis TaxID=2905665 RepID=A0ABR1X5M5_9PEZI